MTTQLNTLKTELREFIELSKFLPAEEWKQRKSRDNKRLFLGPVELDYDDVDRDEQDNIATFIARARNISPAMAECLLVAVERLEQDLRMDDHLVRHHAGLHLQQILNIWEAGK